MVRLEVLERQELRGLQVRLVHRGLLELVEALEHQVQVVLQELQGHLVQVGHLVYQVLQGQVEQVV